MWEKEFVEGLGLFKCDRNNIDFVTVNNIGGIGQGIRWILKVTVNQRCFHALLFDSFIPNKQY